VNDSLSSVIKSLNRTVVEVWTVWGVRTCSL